MRLFLHQRPGTLFDDSLSVNRFREALQLHALEHFFLARFGRLERWNIFSAINFIEAWYALGAAASAIVLRDRCPLLGPGGSALAGGGAELGQLRLGRSRLGIAVGFVVFEHVPGDGDQLARGGHDSDVAVLFLENSTKEDAQWARVLSDVLCRLYQHPAGVAAALLGDGAMITVVAGLVCGRNEANIGRGAISTLEPRNITECREESLRNRDIDTGKSHQQFDPRVFISTDRERFVGSLNFFLDGAQKSKLGVEKSTRVGFELESVDPLATHSAKKAIERYFDQPLVENGMNAILDSRSVCDQRGAVSCDSAQRLSMLVGLPNAGEKIRTKKLSQYFGVNFVGLDFRLGDGARTERVRDNDLPNQWLEHCDDAPSVAGGLERDSTVAGAVCLGKFLQRFAIAGEAHPAQYLAAAVENASLDFSFVDIQADEAHKMTSAVRGGRATWQCQASGPRREDPAN